MSCLCQNYSKRNRNDRDNGIIKQIPSVAECIRYGFRPSLLGLVALGLFAPFSVLFSSHSPCLHLVSFNRVLLIVPFVSLRTSPFLRAFLTVELDTIGMQWIHSFQDY